MNDLISRQAAIDAVLSVIPYDDYWKEQIEKAVNKLPSVQSDRKRGKWIDYTEDGYVECPYCHNATNCDGNKDELHYCYSCGAELR